MKSTYIPIGAKHRLENPGKIDLELIEIQTGSCFTRHLARRNRIDEARSYAAYEERGDATSQIVIDDQQHEPDKTSRHDSFDSHHKLFCCADEEKSIRAALLSRQTKLGH
jgi:hypothetical protein